MPKIVIAEASGYVLNTLIARQTRQPEHPDDTLALLYPDDDGWAFDPAGKWEQGMPLIAEVATKIEKREDGFAVTVASQAEQTGRDILEAGLRAYLVAKAGPEIDVCVLLASRMVDELQQQELPIPPSLEQSMPSDSLLEVCLETQTEPEDWVSIDGPETGVGVESWYRHSDGTEAYVCDDQGDISVEVTAPVSRERG